MTTPCVESRADLGKCSFAGNRSWVLMVYFQRSISQSNIFHFFASLPDFWQELRKSLELSVNLQRKQRDGSSDEYGSIEEEVLSEPEPEPEEPVLLGHGREDPPLSSGNSMQKAAPKDHGPEGGPSQGPDPLVVLEFNPASKSEFHLT